jgi:hypothetical protein
LLVSPHQIFTDCFWGHFIWNFPCFVIKSFHKLPETIPRSCICNRSWLFNSLPLTLLVGIWSPITKLRLQITYAIMILVFISRGFLCGPRPIPVQISKTQNSAKIIPICEVCMRWRHRGRGTGEASRTIISSRGTSAEGLLHGICEIRSSLWDSEMARLRDTGRYMS